MFTAEITLPSNKKRRVRELKNKEYINIIKFCENNDLVGLNELFEELYLDKDLDIYDRFYMLIYVRMLFVGETLSFTTKDGKNVDISLDTVLEKLESNFKDLDTEIVVDNLTIGLGIPNCSFFEDIDDLLTSVIKFITINNKRVEFKDLTVSEQNQVMSKLPANVFTIINKFLDNISNELLNITIIQQNDQFGIEEIKVDIVGNGVMQFISNIYRVDIKSYYELIYMFFQKILPGTNTFYNLSPIESKIFLNIHNKTIHNENKELKN
jgi:septum formation topological specificity factor MinE